MYIHIVTLNAVWPQLFDVDEDNSITRDEFASLLRSTLGVCDLDVTKLFNEIDVDGSDHITYGKFIQCKKKKKTLKMTQFVEYSYFHIHAMVFNKVNIQLKSKRKRALSCIQVHYYSFKMFTIKCLVNGEILENNLFKQLEKKTIYLFYS